MTASQPAKPTLPPARWTQVKTVAGYALQRNDQPFKTPADKDFVLPTEALAEIIVTEWTAQGQNKPKPETMPMTQLASTAIDLVSRDKAQVIDQVTAYAATDLLCHFADYPESLRERQNQLWQPLLDWCALTFDAPLKTGSGIMPLTQADTSLDALRKAVEAYDDFRLTGLRQAVDSSGSLVLGLALAEKYAGAQQIFAAAAIDAEYQAEKWGEDPAVSQRQNGIRADLEICESWFRLLG